VRQFLSLERRRLHHMGLIDAEQTQSGRFWRIVAWLLVEARRQRRLTEVNRRVMAIIEELRSDARFKTSQKARPTSQVRCHQYDPSLSPTDRVLQAMNGESRAS
jgi:hypothetical protein